MKSIINSELVTVYMNSLYKNLFPDGKPDTFIHSPSGIVAMNDHITVLSTIFPN